MQTKRNMDSLELHLNQVSEYFETEAKARELVSTELKKLDPIIRQVTTHFQHVHTANANIQGNIIIGQYSP